MNEEEVLEWLTSVESMDLPDKIEEVNARILQDYIDEHDFVAVLFCEYIHGQDCKDSSRLIFIILIFFGDNLGHPLPNYKLIIYLALILLELL